MIYVYIIIYRMRLISGQDKLVSKIWKSSDKSTYRLYVYDHHAMPFNYLNFLKLKQRQVNSSDKFIGEVGQPASHDSRQDESRWESRMKFLKTVWSQNLSRITA